uniref:centrosomal protein of 170 kDa isoform X1 n=1 Tax=Scatophagus argus TaxID=75038 RepID=UPI001ED7ECD6|nr:centrosomal protein of 170 kDa isoform X1 [Scatophagus argus]XP_046258746.1 centrosomal protein of 170 kDa isoform X1 [Scatophagus argus]XP_046258747.1 centrosomal protein of 170 kDa isoform X1 [Scatophagus argus]XP_046258748.1 centrosomal protein of 170 kDa isoform X1 [Scatophagus argus]
MSVTSWFLVSSGGTRHRLPREMIFVGRDDCELMLQSRSVDKQHAVINYEAGTDEHKVKDLGSLNGTFVNDVRIQEQMYITLKLDDKLRFGYDTNLFTVVRGELTVPEEALKHEKFTSGLQLSKKPSNGETTATTTTSKSPTKTPTKALKSPGGSSLKPAESRATDGVSSSKDPQTKPADTHKAEERVGGDVTALPRGTPLYGQPSWWGDGDADDENSFKQESKSSNKKHDSSVSDSKEARRGEKIKEDGLHASSAHDSSYFEIPTKEGHMANNGIHEIPTKDTEGAATHTTTAQGHASFTIEFDNTSPGKVTIKDHVSKFTPDHHRSRSKKSGAGSGGAGGRDLSTLQAAESKVADWLAQNDPTLVRSESTEDDSKSIKSDVPVHLKRLKGSKHEDGTQSDSENGLGLRFANRRHALEERLKAAHGHVGGGAAGTGGGNVTVSGTRASGSRTAFMIEFYDEENPRKRRSYSFSQTAPLLGGGTGGEGLCPQPPSHPKVFSISTSAATDSGKVPAPIPATVTVGAPTAARVLLKQRSEDPSIGRSSASTGLATGSPTSPSEDTSVVGRGVGTAGGEAGDDHSDKGTYTIELENRNPEEEEARRLIDKVFGVQQTQDSSALSDLKEGKGKETGETGKEALPGDSSWVSQWASLAANHTRTDPEGSGAETAAFLHKERADAFESGASLSRGESSSSLTDRKRRTLPQLPVDDPRAKSSPKALGLRSEIGEKQDTEPQEKENKGDGESPTPMGDGEMTSKRKQGSTSSPSKAPLRTSGSTERRKRSEERKGGGGTGEGGEKTGKPLVRQGSFTIEKPSANVPAELIPRINRGNSGRERSDSVGSMDTATLLKDTEAVMAFLEAKLRDENKLDQKSGKTGLTTHGSGSGFPPRTDSISPESDVDTASTASHVAGEAQRKASVGGEQKRRSLSSMHREKSNMSTASKTSVTSASARERLERKSKARTAEVASRTDARRSVQPSSASSRARQPSLDLTDDDQTSSLPISDILSSDQETYSGPLGHPKLDSRSAKTSTSGSSKTSRTLQAATTSSLNKQASLPQPRPTRASLLRRARLGDTSDTDLADADRVSVASEVSTTSSTSKPPSGRKGLSRLDMLAQPRRNRLGSISARSDSECTVTRSSTSSPRLSAETALRLGLRSSTPTENKLTARMRANSVSKLNETKTKTTTSGYCSPTESPQPEPEGGDVDEELMVSSSSRWRRLPPEYGSTSEEEFGSSRNSPKHGGRSHVRPHHLVPHRSSRLSTTASPGSGMVTGPGGVGVKHRMKEQEEYIRDWTAHSEEIARLFPCVRRISQDLAKDLAILAREIHDVAGEIDSVSSSGTAPSTTVSTAATTPGSAIDTREEVGPARPTQTDIQESMRKLVDRVFDESLNFRKIPPVISTNKAPEVNGKPVELRPRAPDSLEPRALRRRTWNRDEAVLDSLLLNSVSQLSTKIRHSVDKTAGKIRILFKDKDRNWDEIESKLRSESDIPLLKTSNKEISSILLELKRVEKQLQVINVMVDPDGTLDALASLGLTSPTTPAKPQTAKTTSPCATSPGSVPPAKEPMPESLPGPAGSTARVQASFPSTQEAARDPSLALGLTGVGGLPFNRMRPSGEEAIAQK